MGKMDIAKANGYAFKAGQPTRFLFTQHDELKRLWAEDRSARDIAKILGVHEQTVTKHAREMGLPPRVRPKMFLPRKEITKQWLDGMTKTDIAKHHNVSFQTISARLKEWGLTEQKKEKKTPLHLGNDKKPEPDKKPERVIIRRDADPRGIWTQKLDDELFKVGDTWKGRAQFQAKHPHISFQAINARWPLIAKAGVA